MNLYDEDQMKKNKNENSKINKIIITLMIIILLIIIGLIIFIYYLANNPSELTINLDGKESTELENLIEIEYNDDGSLKDIYAPIKDIAPYLGYKAFNGDYITTSEDTNSCYVENDNEIAIYTSDSNSIYKIDKTGNSQEYEKYNIEQNVFIKDGKIYTNWEGLRLGFNIETGGYNTKKKILDIYSLDVYVNDASKLATKYNYKEIDNTFVNEKAILDGFIVVKTEDGLYGVIEYNSNKQNEILGSQYDSILYIPQKKAFLVTRNNEVGIISSNGETIIQPKYDGLTLIDYDNELYLAKKDGLNGVIDSKGNVLIYLEYDNIGIDISQYEKNGIKSGYILLDKLIPVQQNGKWGFFDITGNKVTDIIYDKIGSITTTNKSTSYNLLLIPEYNAIVVNRDGKYTFINTDGKELLSCVFQDMYLEVSSGVNKYYMIWIDERNETKEEKVYDCTKYLK